MNFDRINIDQNERPQMRKWPVGHHAIVASKRIQCSRVVPFRETNMTEIGMHLVWGEGR